jgi:hypothetical protein
VSDEELAELALSAAVDADVGDDAVPIRPVEPTTDLLPDWYMPASAGHAEPGWRRRVALVVVGAILLINAAGLCVTYGPVTFG